MGNKIATMEASPPSPAAEKFPGSEDLVREILVRNKIGTLEASPPSPATEKFPGSEDLVREILVRLPVRSLLKFKSVSKQWYTLISHPQFSLNHTSRTNPTSLIPSSLFFYNSLTENRDLDFLWLNHIPNQSPRAPVPSLSFLDSASPQGAVIKILHSCNGLLLCRFYTESNPSEGGLIYLCVCNPTTKTYKMLPNPDINQNHWIFGISLAFDPCESRHYKVVFVKKSDRDFSIDIYSSENGLWTTSVCTFHLPIRCWFKIGSGVYHNGLIHWIGYHNSNCYSLCYNFGANDLTLIELPPKPSSRSRIRYFGEFKGRLYLISIGNMLDEVFEVLEKDRDTSEWYPRYRVDMNRIVSPFPEIAWQTRLQKKFLRVEYAFKILCFVDRGEEKEDLELVLIVPGKVISFNLKHKTSKVLCESPWKELPGRNFASRSDFNFNSVFPYIESLAPV